MSTNPNALTAVRELEAATLSHRHIARQRERGKASYAEAASATYRLRLAELRAEEAGVTTNSDVSGHVAGVIETWSRPLA